MIELTEKNFGPQPYKIVEINRYYSGNTLLTVQNMDQKTKEINAGYFTKA